MSRRRRKNHLVMVRPDYWWQKGRWVASDDVEWWFRATNLRRFRTVKKMEKEFKKADFSCRISASYYRSTRNGIWAGWFCQWEMEK